MSIVDIVIATDHAETTQAQNGDGRHAELGQQFSLARCDKPG
jgi:hypothetical protein